MTSAQSWPEFFEHVRLHAATYFSSDEIKQTYIDSSIEIDFDVDDLAVAANAHARKRRAGQYEIRLYAPLLAELDRYANDAIERFPSLFMVDNGGRAVQQHAASYLLFLWTDFIICHEWAHVVYGHLEVTGRGQWNELESEPVIDPPELCHALELEADSRATVFTLAGLAARWRDVSIHLYGKVDPTLAWRDYYYGLLLLFDFFEEKHPPGKSGKRTHPHPFVRAYTFQMFVMGECDRVAGLPDTPGSDRQRFFAEMAISYYLTIRNRDPQEYLEASLRAARFCTQIDGILSAHGVAKHRLARSTQRT